MSRYDVAIIGGGPAGLSASLVLARVRWKVVVFNTGVPRNVASPAVQGFLSRDGIHPAELKRVSREQIEKYDIVRMAMESIPSASVVLTGRFSMAPMPMIATWG